MARVLIVDDDDDVRETTAAMLEFCGYEIELAKSGEDALMIIQEKSIDLVLSDVGMAVMNGFELAERVREINQNTKVLLSSGFVSLKRRAAAKGLQIIAKPYASQQALVDAVQNNLDNVVTEENY